MATQTQRKNELLERRRELWEYYHDIDNFRKLFPKRHALPSQFFHNEMFDFLQQRAKISAVIIPRGCGKSTEIITEVIHQIVYRREDYIVYISSDQKLARKFLATIKKELTQNKELTTLFNIKKGKVWQADYAEIELGNGEKCILEAVGSSGTRGFNAYGKRPSWIILDDYEGKKHRESIVLLEKAKDVFFNEIKPAIDSLRGRITLVGTIVHEASILNTIKETGYCVNDISGKPIPLDKIPYLYYEVIQDGKSIWEEQFSIEFLLQERATYEKMGKLSAWYMERMNQCVSPEARPFKDEMIGYYALTDMHKKVSSLSRLMVIDYSELDKTRNDYMVISTGGADRGTGEIYIFDMCYLKTIKLEEKTEAVVKRLREYAPTMIVIENKGGGATFIQYLRAYFLQNGINTPIEPINPQNTGHEHKRERIYHYLYNKFYEKKLLFPLTKPNWFYEMKKEMLYFTLDKDNKQDDGLDSLAYMVHMYDKWGVGSFQDLVERAEIVSHVKNPYIF